MSPQLRSTGSYERRGRPNRSADPARLRAQATELAAARTRLLTDGPVRLSALGELDEAAFPLFLRLLDDALAPSGRGDHEGVVTSADGALGVAFRPAGDGTRATARTSTAVLRGPDHELSVEAVGP